ncbi:MAG: hypothetical protein ABIJ82_00930 [Patescibacteria group bacterium]
MKELKPFPSGGQSHIDWCNIDVANPCPYKSGTQNCGIKKRLSQVPLKGGVRKREAERLWKLAQTNPDVFNSLCVNALYPPANQFFT